MLYYRERSDIVRLSPSKTSASKNWIAAVALRANGRKEDNAVPKLKSHRGAKKRFKLTSTGKVLRSHSLANHILTKKTQKRKRKLRKRALVSDSMLKGIRRIIAV